ncbi:hypothetical protein PUR34_21540 [Streptomyces sp. JV185]|uniref:hypothetical protein n=1 Tax=Streptomyces sp. JV185 TaxID=858638 RepID=UPI002E7918FB|nr:hypothetical protein [Streptomyces sp. JV185]MEE1770645.1 hypothetical protein [Streptomyces sp. JV185]
MAQMPEYHFVITAQKALPGGGAAMADFSGYFAPEPGWTRHDTFLAIRAEFEKRYPDMGRACIVFFSLEPNTL